MSIDFGKKAFWRSLYDDFVKGISSGGRLCSEQKGAEDADIAPAVSPTREEMVPGGRQASILFSSHSPG